ncbi:hypothetical protein PIB30_021311 [Stylosanthes scabra]|uniref:Uncharacterized protein n=1 Tax=Stylosanthes scabra TaxID=79078 RepID=A0ABU6Z5L2_9FABA|nr:hypothetical protein [Stylosanthes scabra]
MNDERMDIGTSLHKKTGNSNHGTYVTRRVRILQPSELGGNCSGYWARLAQIHAKPPLRRPKANTRPKSPTDSHKGPPTLIIRSTQDPDHIYTDLPSSLAPSVITGSPKSLKRNRRQIPNCIGLCGGFATDKKMLAFSGSDKTAAKSSHIAALYTYVGGLKTLARRTEEEEAIAEIESRDASTKELSQNDSFAQVLGNEHSGQVCGLGFGLSPTQLFGQTSQSSSHEVQIHEYQKEIAALQVEAAEAKK